jgi:hypothetical protein
MERPRRRGVIGVVAEVETLTLGGYLSVGTNPVARDTRGGRPRADPNEDRLKTG